MATKAIYAMNTIQCDLVRVGVGGKIVFESCLRQKLTPLARAISTHRNRFSSTLGKASCIGYQHQPLNCSKKNIPTNLEPGFRVYRHYSTMGEDKKGARDGPAPAKPSSR